MGVTIKLTEKLTMHFSSVEDIRNDSGSSEIVDQFSPEDVFSLSTKLVGRKGVNVYPFSREETERIFRELGRALGYVEADVEVKPPF